MIHYFDRNPEIVEKLQEQGLKATQTDDPVKDIDYDWIVSPANCYGFMDGGFDLYLAQNLDINPKTGWRPYLQKDFDITKPFLEKGEVRKIPEKNLLVATTVKSPSTVKRRPSSKETVKKCLEKIIQNTSSDETVACPGLGTGYGNLRPEEFAEIAKER